MRSQRLAVPLLVLTLCACQDGTDSSARPPAGAAASAVYTRDLERICHSEERSGSLDQPRGQRAMAVAYWLASNIESQDGRDFLARFTRAQPSAKVALLEDETRRANIAQCPLIARWARELSER